MTVRCGPCPRPHRTQPIRVEPYPSTLTVYVHPPGAELLVPRAAALTCHYDGNCDVHLHTNTRPEYLVHEAVHVAIFTLRHAGVEHCPEADEAYTYTTQQVFRHLQAAQREARRRV